MFAKKNVVAAAALTLVVVAAQAQVTVYGNLDVSVGRKQAIDTTAPIVNGKFAKTSTTNVDSSDLSQSFIGFKGQEDLGGDLKAVFKLESELAVDTGAANGGSTFWNRNATVGLAGDFGAVNLGRFENLFKLEGQAFNPFGASGTFSPTFNALGTDGSSWANGVSYVSPNLGGLTLSAQYSAKEASANQVTATNYAGGAYALSANYVAGPLGLSAVFGEVKSVDSSASSVKQRPWLLGASYDFGVVKLFGQYGQDKLDTKIAGTSGKLKGYQLGASVPVTADGAVLVSYGEGKLSGDIASAPVRSKVRDLSLGYVHNLSKRTNVYAAAINERVNGEVDLTNATSATGRGTTTSFAVGVRHAF